MEHTGRFRTVLFNETSLSLIKGKYYVVATVPQALREKLGKQIRRSTGTSDRKDALRRKHDITEELYDVFREHLRTSKYAMTEKFFEQQGIKTTISDDTLYELLQVVEHLKATNQSVGFNDDDKAIAELEAALATPDNTYDPDTKLSSVAALYFDQRTFGREKTKKSAQVHVKEFIDLVGDIDVKDVEKLHGYQYCDKLDKDGQFAKTITSKLSSIRSLMTWSEQKGIIKASPLTNMSLKTYGKKSESYRPIPDEITRAILQDTKAPKQDILLLAALYLTGCRLDEWATASYDKIETSPEGFRYIDLRDSKVKNNPSKRYVPLHPVLDKLLGEGEGRIFSYTTNEDGKATNAASKSVMKLIRRHTKDKLHTAHSYRHGFKDTLRNAGVSKEVNDFITGHSSGDVAGNYGSGVSLPVRYEAICKINADVVAS